MIQLLVKRLLKKQWKRYLVLTIPIAVFVAFIMLWIVGRIGMGDHNQINIQNFYEEHKYYVLYACTDAQWAAVQAELKGTEAKAVDMLVISQYEKNYGYGMLLSYDAVISRVWELPDEKNMAAGEIIKSRTIQETNGYSPAGRKLILPLLDQKNKRIESQWTAGEEELSHIGSVVSTKEFMEICKENSLKPFHAVFLECGYEEARRLYYIAEYADTENTYFIMESTLFNLDSSVMKSHIAERNDILFTAGFVMIFAGISLFTGFLLILESVMEDCKILVTVGIRSESLFLLLLTQTLLVGTAALILGIAAVAIALPNLVSVMSAQFSLGSYQLSAEAVGYTIFFTYLMSVLITYLIYLYMRKKFLRNHFEMKTENSRYIYFRSKWTERCFRKPWLLFAGIGVWRRKYRELWQFVYITVVIIMISVIGTQNICSRESLFCIEAGDFVILPVTLETADGFSVPISAYEAEQISGVLRCVQNKDGTLTVFCDGKESTQTVRQELTNRKLRLEMIKDIAKIRETAENSYQRDILISIEVYLIFGVSGIAQLIAYDTFYFKRKEEEYRNLFCIGMEQKDLRKAMLAEAAYHAILSSVPGILCSIFITKAYYLRCGVDVLNVSYQYPFAAMLCTFGILLCTGLVAAYGKYKEIIGEGSDGDIYGKTAKEAV